MILPHIGDDVELLDFSRMTQPVASDLRGQTVDRWDTSAISKHLPAFLCADVVAREQGPRRAGVHDRLSWLTLCTNWKSSGPPPPLHGLHVKSWLQPPSCVALGDVQQFSYYPSPSDKPRLTSSPPRLRPSGGVGKATRGTPVGLIRAKLRDERWDKAEQVGDRRLAWVFWLCEKWRNSTVGRGRVEWLEDRPFQATAAGLAPLIRELFE